MKKVMLAVGLGVGLGYGAAALFGAPSGAPGGVAHAKSDAKSAYEMLDLLADIFNRVEDSYVEEVEGKKLVEAAINGMLTSLDPHSSYLPPEDYSKMREQTRGEFGGLGIEVTMEEGFVKVVSPIEGTPAERAGVQAGDFITHLNGESVLGMTLNDAVERMRGKPGSTIDLTVARESAEEPLKIQIERAVITVYPVKARAIGNIGVLRITTFNEQTSSDLEVKIAELKEEIGEDIKGFVVDLRNNPGGLLKEAITVSDAFLDKGAIVSTRGRVLDQAEHRNATKGDLTGGLPLVVLINNGSASASEIVAGALQDHRRAIVVGTKSFGKGSVQTVVELRNKGAIRLTTARYYTPSGRSIQALGIDPDILVEQLNVEKPEGSDRPQRSEATLRGHLESETGGDDQKDLDAIRADLRKSDYQLFQALNHMDTMVWNFSRSTQ